MAILLAEMARNREIDQGKFEIIFELFYVKY
jgi:hypothetical protein